MTTADLDHNMALFCDFENVALGVRDAKIAFFVMTETARPCSQLD
jgi:hypothetical protein